ncbi:hypothetical protein SLE2022_303860 [Rubroshorea leprosula]
MAAGKSDEARDKIKIQKQNTTTGLRTCNNILAMTKPLHSKTPFFIGDKSVNLSWKEATKPTAASNATTTGVKRPANAGNGSGNMALKKGRGADGLENHLVNRALQGISYGGRTGARGRGRGRGRGRDREDVGEEEATGGWKLEAYPPPEKPQLALHTEDDYCKSDNVGSGFLSMIPQQE